MSTKSPKSGKTENNRALRRKERQRRREARRTAVKPRWVPSSTPEFDLHYLAKWHNRAWREPGDHITAPGSAGVIVFEVVGPGISWAMLKLLWREEEALARWSCDLCGGPQLLYAYAFGGQFGRGTVERRCPECHVLYREGDHASRLAPLLMRLGDALGYRRGERPKVTVYPQVMWSPNLPARPPINGAELMKVVSPRSGATLSGQDVDPDPPERGAWTLEMPQRAGTYLVATSGGRTQSHRRVEWDAAAQAFRETADQKWFEWWWSEPVQAPGGAADSVKDASSSRAVGGDET